MIKRAQIYAPQKKQTNFSLPRELISCFTTPTAIIQTIDNAYCPIGTKKPNNIKIPLGILARNIKKQYLCNANKFQP